MSLAAVIVPIAKLVEAAKEVCPRSLLIETEDEVRPEDVRGLERVGVSAGASTPDWMIRKVVEDWVDARRGGAGLPVEA
jgi:4-hydroxy-3-methylbut-2-enyl diphosphate reductase IspH